MDGMVLLSMDNILVLRFPIIIRKEVLVDDGVDVDVTQGFDGGADETGFVLFSVNREGTEKFLGLVKGFFDGEGPLSPVDRGVDFLQPRES